MSRRVLERKHRSTSPKGMRQNLHVFACTQKKSLAINAVDLSSQSVLASVNEDAMSVASSQQVVGPCYHIPEGNELGKRLFDWDSVHNSSSKHSKKHTRSPVAVVELMPASSSESSCSDDDEDELPQENAIGIQEYLSSSGSDSSDEASVHIEKKSSQKSKKINLARINCKAAEPKQLEEGQDSPQDSIEEPVSRLRVSSFKAPSKFHPKILRTCPARKDSERKLVQYTGKILQNLEVPEPTRNQHHRCKPSIGQHDTSSTFVECSNEKGLIADSPTPSSLIFGIAESKPQL